ncbi:hypothetical protein [Myxococcus stipitatus]|uniref:hypothetical protein n=1 Tax=Myxococcus stipitatus TaxID=83455 RepID=UPI0002E9A934|nr:hypothetical protein [Myxococcus stipitatus]
MPVSGGEGEVSRQRGGIRVLGEGREVEKAAPTLLGLLLYLAGDFVQVLVARRLTSAAHRYATHRETSPSIAELPRRRGERLQFLGAQGDLLDGCAKRVARLLHEVEHDRDVFSAQQECIHLVENLRCDGSAHVWGHSRREGVLGSRMTTFTANASLEGGIQGPRVFG